MPTTVEFAVAIAEIASHLYALKSALSESMGPPMSCPVFIGQTTDLGEDNCVWGKATGEWTNQSGTTGRAAIFRFGGQKEVAPNWFVGGALGGGKRWTQTGSGSAGTGEQYDASIAVKRITGPWLFAGAFALSTASTHLTQGGGALAGDTTALTAGGRLRGAYDFAFAGWYLRPRLDLDLVYTNRPAFDLTARGTDGLAVQGSSKTSFVATPMVELGGRVDLDGKTILRPYVAVGASFQPDNNWTSTASATGPLAALGNFQSTTGGPSVLANVEAGVQLYRTRGLEVKAEYTLSTGTNYLSQGASLRGAWHF